MRNYLPMLFLFSLSIFFTGNFDYDKAWKKVDSLLQSGLPESAAEKIEEIYSMASKENNVPQQIKATVYLAQVTFDHEELGLENVITDLEEKIENTPSPGKEVMTSILAEVISSYYQNQSYIISQRTNLEERSKDIRTWTPVNFNEYIHELYWKSIDEKTKAYETKDFEDILENAKADFDYRPSLYEVLVDRVLNYYRSSRYYNLVQETFSINKPEYLSPYAAFADIEINEEGLNNKLNVLKLYESVIQKAIENEDLKALVNYDLDRLSYVKSSGNISNEDSLYLAALDYGYQNIKGEDKLQYKYKVAEYYKSKGEKVKAVAIANEILDEKPCEIVKALTKNLIIEIERKELFIQAEQVVPSNENFLLYVRQMNVEEVFFTLRQANYDVLESLQNNDQDKSKAIIKDLNVLKEWSEKQDFEDYDAHTFEKIMDGLSKGQYIITVGSEKGKMVSFLPLIVSDLSYVAYDKQGKKELSVRDRNSGKPLAGVTVKVYTTNYDRVARKQVPSLINTLISDKDGNVSFSVAEGVYNISYVFEKGDDILDLSLRDYSRSYNDRSKSRTQTELFTDRAIYRPGQTVYFKALALYFNEDNIPKIAAGENFEVRLLDANRQEVSRMKLAANEFGSASGNFVLPQGQLSGVFTLDGLNKSIAFRVEEYKRPTFEVMMDSLKGQYVIGDSIKVTGSAQSYSGAALSDSKVTYTVSRVSYYGWWDWYRRYPSKSVQIEQGELTANSQGGFDIEFAALPDDTYNSSQTTIYTYEVKVSVTDLNGETRDGNQKVVIANRPYGFEWNIDSRMMREDLEEIMVYAKTAAGEKVSTKAIVTIQELVEPDEWQKNRRWGIPTDPIYRKGEFEKSIKIYPYESENQLSKYPVKRTVYEETISIPVNGLNLNLKKLLTGGAYHIEIKSVETFEGESIIDDHYFTVVDFENEKFPVNELLYTQMPEENLVPSEEFKITLGSSEKDLFVRYHLIRNHEVVKSDILKLNKTAEITYTPTEKDKGGMTLYLDMIKKNSYHLNQNHINIPWSDKDLNVELVTERNVIEPGSEEHWKLKISGPKKDGALAEVLATMYDMSLDQFVKHTYNFSPFPTNFSYMRVFSQGFNTTHPRQIDYTWNRVKYNDVEGRVIPTIKGFNRYFSFRQYMYAESEMMMDEVQVRGVRTGAAKNYVDGVRAEAPPMANEAIEEDSDADDGSSKKEKSVVEEQPNDDGAIALRENLNETVFYYPQLQTDKEGNVILDFTMNEALTTWKLLVFAHDKDLRYGMTSAEVQTQKEVMIIPNPPRYFRQNDKMKLPAMVSNLSDSEQTIVVELNLSEGEENVNTLFGINDTKQTITIPAGESKRVAWNVAIPSGFNGLITYAMTAKGIKHTDGQTGVLPVLTNKILVTETNVISVRGNEEKTIPLVNWKDKPSATPYALTVEYTSNPIWYAIQALPYLMEYPYDCTEQVLNRYYANTLASHIVNASPKIKQVFEQWKTVDTDAFMSNLSKNQELKSILLEESPWVRDAISEEEQKKRIAVLFDLNKIANEKQVAIAKLVDRQRGDGSFSWFPGGPSNVYMTQYIVEGIAHLHHLGVITNRDHEAINIVQNAMRFLDQKSNERFINLKTRMKNYGGSLDNDHLDPTSIHYLYIRSFEITKELKNEHEKAYEYYMSQAAKYWLKKGYYQEALIGMTLHRAENKVYLDIQKSLKERSLYNEELGRYWNLGNGYQWYDLPLESHAAILEFFTEINESSSYVDDMKIWLLKNKQTNRWSTTKATANVIYSLLLQGEGGKVKWIDQQNKATITIGNDILNTDATATAGLGYVKKRFEKEEIKSSYDKITVDNNNENIAWGAVYYQYFEDMDQVEGFDDNALNIIRTFYKEEASDEGPKLVQIGEGAQLQIGDKIVSRIEIRVDRTMEFVHLKDMRPGGVEPINQLSGYRWNGGLGYYESVRDVATNFFFDRLPKGTYVFEYATRAVYSGEFSSGISTIQCMYAPEFTSHSNGLIIEIE